MKPNEHYMKAMHRMEMTLLEIRNLLSKKQKKKIELNSSNDWLDKQEVMQLLHISTRSLYNLRKDGKLPTYAIRGKMYFKRGDIQQLLSM